MIYPNLRPATRFFTLALCLLLPAAVSAQSPEAAQTDAVQEAEVSIEASDPVSIKTAAQLKASREALLSTHEALPLPNVEVEEVLALQGLPGEDAYQTTLESFSELAEIAPGRPMTMKEAFILADERNPMLGAARVNSEKAQAKLHQAWAMLMPNVAASLQWAHLGNVPMLNLGDLMGGAPVPGGGTPMAAQDSVSLNLTVGMSIINVANWFNLRILDKSTDLTDLGIEDGRQQLLAGVAQTYLAALLTGEVVKVQRVQLKTALNQLELAQGRYDGGVDVKLSVIQAQHAVEQACQALIDAIWSYETAREALAIMTNTDGFPVPQPSPLKALPNLIDDSLEANAIEQNRSLQIQRATQEIQKLSLDAAIASFFPSLGGAWQYNYSLTNPVGMAAQKSSWTLALSLTIPLFDYSKYGVLDERKAEIRQTQFNMQNIENNTRQAVRKGRREYYSAIFSVENARRQESLANEALSLTEASYSNGVATFVDVSNARNTATAASVALITTKIQADLSLISLISHLGHDIMEIAE